ncbi:MAG: cupin domain-containing protein [Synergistetes bacterium]|nr:MAG: Mannose-6-phosphate isomerase [bacterium 42_11]MBC7331571.1 cupin domain-containing protein [Synergistota bacterium]MDK2871863.1 hypothetical protein [bacterium]
MLVRDEERSQPVERESFRGGEGKIYVSYFLNEERDEPGALRVMRITIPPGSSIGYHQHVGEEEVYLILKGRGEVNDNGEISEVKSGDMVLTRSGFYHGIRNIGDEPLELFAMVSKV